MYPDSFFIDLYMEEFKEGTEVPDILSDYPHSKYDPIYDYFLGKKKESI